LFGDKTHKLAEVMTAHSSDEMYRLLLSHWKEPTQLVLGAVEPTTPLTEPYIGMVLGDPTQRMMLFDTITYLPDDILVKIDRATMAVSLESRLPFLDHQLVEFAWRVPLQHKITGNMGKMLLRELLYKYVPKALIERPKQGFSVPIDTWLRGPLRDWVEDFLAEVRLKRDGLLNPQLVRERWKEHLSGKRNWQYSLWCVLMLQVWLDRQRSAAGVISPA
jgi:asparagine synthase (glutamine-hydrolysing)